VALVVAAVVVLMVVSGPTQAVNGNGGRVCRGVISQHL
jgi:hypothetical protein